MSAAAVTFVATDEEAVALIVTPDRLHAARMKDLPFQEIAEWGRDWLARYYARPKPPKREPGETNAAWLARSSGSPKCTACSIAGRIRS